MVWFQMVIRKTPLIMSAAPANARNGKELSPANSPAASHKGHNAG